jgi:hypothetical protein
MTIGREEAVAVRASLIMKRVIMVGTSFHMFFIIHVLALLPSLSVEGDQSQ